MQIKLKFKGFLMLMLILAIAGMMATLIQRTEKYDDAWWGELSYFLANDGIIRSNLFVDMYGWGDRVLMTHKLWVVCTALWIKIWGFSIYVIKTVSLPFVLLQVFLFYRYSQKIWMLATLFYLTCGVVVRYAFVSRPELAMATFGFMSWLALQRFREKYQWRWVFVAGISSGITALFHLQGAIFMSAGALWLLWCKEYRAFVGYCIVSFCTFLFYFTDVVLYDSWDLYYNQTAHDPATHALRDISVKLKNLAEIPKMMLHSIGEIPGTIFTFSCLFLRRKAKLQSSDLEKYLLLLAICFVVLSNRVVHEYMVLFFPFMLVYCAEILVKVGFGSRNKISDIFSFQYNWITWLTILYLVAGFAHDAKRIVKNFNTEPLYQRNARLHELIGDRPKIVIAPQCFIFDHIEHMHIIGLAYYHHYNSFKSDTLTPELFFKDAKKKGVDSIILENNDVTMEYEPPLNISENFEEYHLIYRDERYRIYSVFKAN